MGTGCCVYSSMQVLNWFIGGCFRFMSVCIYNASIFITSRRYGEWVTFYVLCTTIVLVYRILIIHLTFMWSAPNLEEENTKQNRTGVNHPSSRPYEKEWIWNSCQRDKLPSPNSPLDKTYNLCLYMYLKGSVRVPGVNEQNRPAAALSLQKATKKRSEPCGLCAPGS